MLSLYVRTDPRDPANTNHVPGWLIAARNHLRELEATARNRHRAQRLALPELTERAGRDLEMLEPGQRGQSVALFLAASGTLERRLTLQLPVRQDSVLWVERPYVSPLVDVVERGQPAGLVLVGGEQVRLLHCGTGVRRGARGLDMDAQRARPHGVNTQPMPPPTRPAHSRRRRTGSTTRRGWRTAASSSLRPPHAPPRPG